MRPRVPYLRYRRPRCCRRSRLCMSADGRQAPVMHCRSAPDIGPLSTVAVVVQQIAALRAGRSATQLFRIAGDALALAPANSAARNILVDAPIASLPLQTSFAPGWTADLFGAQSPRCGAPDAARSRPSNRSVARIPVAVRIGPQHHGGAFRPPGCCSRRPSRLDLADTGVHRLIVVIAVAFLGCVPVRRRVHTPERRAERLNAVTVGDLRPRRIAVPGTRTPIRTPDRRSRLRSRLASCLRPQHGDRARTTGRLPVEPEGHLAAGSGFR